VHRFDPQRRLVLGGVEIACARGGLAGHSDADVLAHALAGALLGALALGDLGRHFPDTDARWRGVSSLEILRAAYALVQARGFALVNCDATVVAEEPRLAPHIEAMRAALAGVLQVPIERVSIQATTAERLGALGRAEGIAAHAVVLVSDEI
jgi:2-C-methyl-D-erythritol 2,4-cyclodiphosphate synthase